MSELFRFESMEGCHFVTAFTVAKDELSKELCILSHDESTNQWMFVKTEPHDILTSVRQMKFDSQEAAANFLLAVQKCARNFQKEHPWPEDLQHYLINQTYDLITEYQQCCSRLRAIRNQLEQLRKFGIDGNIDSVTYATNDFDKDEIVKSLLEFTVFVEKQEVPFVSEAALYPLLGKEDARTALALMKRICEALSPQIVIEKHL